MPIPSGYTSGQIVQAVPVPSGVVQVLSTTKTDTFTMSSVTFADVTGLSVTITPTRATSKIFVTATIMVGNNTGAFPYFRLLRGSTAIGNGDTAGTRTSVIGSVYNGLSASTQSLAISFFDSPATTSATTYKIQIASATAATAMYVNRSDSDTDSADRGRGSSTITVMEVLA